MTVSYLNRFRLPYLSTPYTKYAKGHDAAFMDAAEIAGKLALNGIFVFSPIVATHPICMAAKMSPFNSAPWLEWDKQMIEICDALVVADLPGWEESDGVHKERLWFLEQRKPMYLLETETMEVGILEAPLEKKT